MPPTRRRRSGIAGFGQAERIRAFAEGWMWFRWLSGFMVSTRLVASLPGVRVPPVEPPDPNATTYPANGGGSKAVPLDLTKMAGKFRGSFREAPMMKLDWPNA